MGAFLAGICALGGTAVTAPQSSGQTPVGQPPTPQTSSAPGDTSALAREATTWLAELIKINTTNPPGNEEAAAKYIAGILQKEGIASELLPMAPGRSALVARLNASSFADPSKALLLVAHMDVVGVERAKWTVDPFGAVPKDGYIYGRGAVDDKGMLAANLAAFIYLKRTNARLNRDVIFLATASEEGGGDASIKMLIAKYWDKIAAKYSINEGGNVFVKNGKVQYVAVQASEKVAMNITVTAKGASGHASIPVSNNAVTHLAAAVEKIGNYQAPVHLTTIVRRYFEGIAPLEDDELAKWIRSIETPDRGEHATRVLADANPMWNAMMRDTISPTMLSAGVRANVIPSEASATLNVRLLPGNTITVLMSALNKLVNDPAVTLELQKDGGLAAPDSSLESDFYAAITKASAEEFGGVPVLPFQSTWATDSAQLRLHNVQSYGLVPFPLTDEDLKRMHGDDERVPAAAFAKGVSLMVRLLSEFATSH
ncbi:MAG TPA: M20/M25/M40 family metallo-hydrolase [Candidatus Acidoferrum sp.]|nr:M20/M25/M40 family metallo-hydrolase [Candidatus Acidoferrum sp.]